jgi:hypothetical protein
MKTCSWMERVALAMDGEWTPEVESHVNLCSECRELFEDRDLLREPPLVPDSAIAAVRARVLKQVSPSRSWFWQIAATVLIAAAGIGWWLLRPPVLERIDVAVAAPGVPELVPAHEPIRVARVPRDVRRVKPSRSPASLALALRDAMGPQTAPPVSGSGSVLLAVQTEDPDVVIVLVSESKGDAE